MRRYTKIRYDGKEVFITWEEARLGEDRKVEYKNRAATHVDFDAALRALKSDVMDILEFHDDYGKGLRVQSVSFSVSDKGVAGAVVTSLKEGLALSASPAVFNTPYLMEESEEKRDQGVMPDGMVRRLNALRREADCYIDGSKRGEPSLFDKKKKDAPELAGV